MTSTGSVPLANSHVSSMAGRKLFITIESSAHSRFFNSVFRFSRIEHGQLVNA